MSGPLWSQIVFGAVIAVPALAMVGAVLTLAVGGILGCGECILARMGAAKLSPGVVSIKHHGIPTAVG
jgi:predicted phage tail protein